MIFLDWSGVDLSSNPLHPASKLFDSRSSMELQCIYILNIESLGVNVVLQKEGRCRITHQKLPILYLTNNLIFVVNLNNHILLI